MRATVAYPAAVAGTNTPVWGTTERFPIVFILHGNHQGCFPASCDHNCNPANRVPNHHGYDYLLDLWASHGIIGVSIDGYDVTCLDDRFVERAALILEHIRYWEDWSNPAIPDFWLGQRDGGSAHFALRAKDRASVDRFHEAAVAAGGKDNGEPGLRSHYHENYYAAYVHDADGNNVEAVCHDPQ